MSHISKLDWFANFHTYDIYAKKLLVELSNFNYNARSYSKLKEIVGTSDYAFDCMIRCLVADGIINVYNSNSDANILMVALSQRLEIKPTLLLVLQDGLVKDSVVLELTEFKDNKAIFRFFNRHRVLEKDELRFLQEHGSYEFLEDGHHFRFITTTTKYRPAK